MKRRAKKIGSSMMILTMILSLFGTLNLSTTSAATKPKMLKKTTITVGAKKTLKVTGVKAKKIKKTTWSVKPKKIAVISKKKKNSVVVTGKKKGKTTITAKVRVGKKTTTLKCKVTVKAKKIVKVAPTKTPTLPPTKTPPSTPTLAPSLSLEKTELAMLFNQNETLQVNVVPENASITWTSSDTDVATVNNAKVKAVGAGTAVITATSNGISATCQVSVTKSELNTVILNTDFEDSVIEPWTRRFRVVEGQPDVAAVIDETGGVDDSKYLKITNRNQAWNGALLDLSKLVEPSATYRFTAQVKAPTISNSDGILLSSQTMAVATGKESYATLAGISLAGVDLGIASSAEKIVQDPKEWTNVEYTVSTPDDISSFGIYFETKGDPVTDICVDNATLTLIDRNVPDFNIPSLYQAYQNIFPYLGVAASYDQLMGDNGSDFIASQYNSVTMGNEMKPDAVYPSSSADDKFMSISEAKALGYYLPSNYEEFAANKKNIAGVPTLVVPILNFTAIDALMKQTSEKGLKMRYHALLWHEQTPTNFFKKKYTSTLTGENCSQEEMDCRIEFFVKNVMKHILESPYADVIYSVDVANEYFHGNNVSATKPTFYREIYNIGLDGNFTTEPPYVKKAFQHAYDIMKEKNRTDISLVYNDYGEYASGMPEKIIALYQYLNTKDEINVSGDKICDGVGMQSHLTMSDNPTPATYAAALEKFREAGLEIQVTELDAGWSSASNEKTPAEEAAYYKAIMQSLIDAKKAGANITSVTIWGLYDAVSWRLGLSPLPFKGLYNPKESFYAMLEAANTVTP